MIAAPRGHSPGLSVLVATWNGWALTRRALRSLYSTAPPGLDLEVIVADNGSTDETRSALAAEFPSVRVLALGSNCGFAAANNRALEVARSQLLLLLNNDTVLDQGSLAALLQCANSRPEFHVFAAQMVRFDAPQVVDNRGIYLDATAHCRQIDTGAPTDALAAPVEVFGASGGACLIRRSVVDAIGLFDESLESYLEDCDFALRARAAGYRCLYIPQAVVRHVGSATGNRISRHKLYLIQRNALIVRRRWIRLDPWHAASWLFHAREVYHVARSVFTGHPGVVLRAKRDALRSATRAEADAPTTQQLLRSWFGVRRRPAPPPHPAGATLSGSAGERGASRVPERGRPR